MLESVEYRKMPILEREKGEYSDSGCVNERENKIYKENIVVCYSDHLYTFKEGYVPLCREGILMLLIYR